MPRVTVRLHGHHVSFDPPQYVATFSVEHESDGRRFELMPATAEEVDDGVAVLRRLPTAAPSSATAAELLIGPGIAAAYLGRLPLVREIDLAHLPSDFKRSSTSNVASFEFTPGERYAVTLVSEIILQAIVVAG